MSDPYKAALSLQTLQTALGYYQAGQLILAEELCRQVLGSDPRNGDALHMLGAIAAQSGRNDEAIELFNKAVQAKKNVPLFHFNLGMALQKAGKADEALLKYKKAVSLDSNYLDAHLRIAGILQEQGRLDEAELRFRRIIALQPENTDARHALALACQTQGKIDDAIAQYKSILSLRTDSFTAHNDFGVLLNKLGRYEEAAEQYRKALTLNAGFAEAHYNLGNTLRDLGQPDAAVESYTKALQIRPNLPEARINLGTALKKLGLMNEAITQYEQALILKPDSPGLLAELVHMIHHACAWDRMGDYETRLLEMVQQGREDIFPFMILGTAATARDQLTCATAFSRHRELPREKMFSHAGKKQNGRIKIGYLSSDLHEHATAYLMAEMFERHDRSRFEVTAYSYGPDDKSPMRQRLTRAFEHFVDLQQASDAEAARKIYEDNTDILVDLKGGYTGDARIGIAAFRPAPVQVSFLGYPGTMGVSFIDYIIADEFLIPPDQQRYYSEKAAYLPDTYQPNDTHRKISETTPARNACGLPEKGFVFCCFNVCYKITPDIFAIWMRLLKSVPDSVLWLLDSNLSVKDNLKKAAAAHGIDPSRLVFAPRAPLADHLARHRLADLFLDTLPVNAHTTASDALWAGLPVLTCAGATFAGRVAGSLLTAAGLPELITHSLADYEATALKLARNPLQLSEIRQKIESGKNKMPLFDVKKFTRNIENLYEDIWREQRTGKQQ